MKRVLLTLSIFTSISSVAQAATYTNSSGCTVEVDNRRNGTIFYVTQGKKTEIVGITYDMSSGNFVYCADSALQINSFEGSKGTHILMACNEHQNDHAITRGRVDIDIMDKELTRIAIDGQVKKLFGWKQDTKIECLDLVRKQQ